MSIADLVTWVRNAVHRHKWVPIDEGEYYNFMKIIGMRAMENAGSRTCQCDCGGVRVVTRVNLDKEHRFIWTPRSGINEKTVTRRGKDGV